MKTKHLVHIMVFRVVTCGSDVRLPFIYLHSFTVKTMAYIKYLDELVLVWIERWAAGTPSALRLNSVPGEPSVGYEKVFAITSPLTLGHLTLQIAIPLIIMCKAPLRDQQNFMQHQR